jgi:peptidoglycan/xylan/chitin deacetylase (PgdA/CDA1 family)
MEGKGIFTISLDFELYWGFRDKRSLDSVQELLENTHRVFPRMLGIFRKYDVKATFATVGLLAAESREDMFRYIPSEKPQYTNPNLSPYTDEMILVGDNPDVDSNHYAGKLLDLLREYPEHEIGTHTFSHYYCQAEGGSLAAFRADLKAAEAISRDKNLGMDSIVFPRNECTPAHLEICKELGIKTYRGIEPIWFRNPKPNKRFEPVYRIIRTLDCYLNISGNHCYNLENIERGLPLNVPSSRFLRPYMPKGGRILETLKIRRIKKGMTQAAKKGKLFHLWWHPHNFGNNSEENLRTFDEILQHYKELERLYGFQSSTMGEVGTLVSTMQMSKNKSSYGDIDALPTVS